MIPGRPFCRTVGEKPGPRLQGPKASPEPRVDLCQTSFPRAMGFPYRCRVVCPGILCRHHRGRSVHAGTQGGGLCGQHLLLRKVAQSLETAPPWWRPHLLRAHFSGPNFFFFFSVPKAARCWVHHSGFSAASKDRGQSTKIKIQLQNWDMGSATESPFHGPGRVGRREKV